MINQVIKGIHRRYFFAIVLLFCLCVLAYSNSLQNQFTADDHVLISDNRLTHSLKFLPEIFKRPLFGGESKYYRPLTHAFLMIEYCFFKSNPRGYYIANILSHFIICVLFFQIIYSLFNNYTLSLVTSFVYAIHPIHHTIINQCSQNVTLVGICMLSSLICFTEFIRDDTDFHKGNRTSEKASTATAPTSTNALVCRRRLSFYYSSLFLFLIALLIRETAMVLPLYLICILMFLKGYKFKRCAYVAAPFFIGSVGYFILRLFFFSLKNNLFNEFTKSFTLLEYMAGYVHLLSIYLSSIVIPKDIVWMFNIPSIREYTIIPIISFVLISLAIVFMIVKYWKRGPRSFGFVWFLAGALPTLLLISNRPFFGLSMETHWFYIPSMGIFLFISSFLLQLKRYINVTLWMCLIVSILLFYGFKTRAYNLLWISPRVYNEYWMSRYPNNISRQALATVYLSEGKYKKAESLLRECLLNSRIKIGDSLYFSRTRSSLYNSLGKVYEKQGMINKAMHMFDTARKINPHDAKAYFNLAGIFLEREMLNETIINYEKAVERDPYILEAQYNLAILYKGRGDDAKALEAHSKAIAIDKDCFVKNVKQQ